MRGRVDLPDSGQFADLLMQQQKKRLDALDFVPERLQAEISSRRPIVRGDVLMHSSEHDEGYRMKRRNIERHDNSPFFLQWPVLCEFATFWGRDEHILTHFPWGADPCGVTHPDPERGFSGWELSIPYEVPKVTKVPVPEAKYEPTEHAPIMQATVDSTTQESPPAATKVEQQVETATIQLPSVEFTEQQLLVHYGEEFLGKLGVVADEDDLSLFAQTLRPAAELLLKKLAERDVVAPSVPSLADLIIAGQASADNSARAEELQQQAENLSQRESELASLAEQLDARSRELDQLMEMIEESAEEAFAKERQSLLELQASTRAEAARLDLFRQTLLRAYDQ